MIDHVSIKLDKLFCILGYSYTQQQQKNIKTNNKSQLKSSSIELKTIRFMLFLIIHTALPYLVFAIGFFMTASNLFNLALALDIPVLANHQFLSSDVKNIIASIVNILFNALVAFLYLLTAYMVYNIKGRPNKTSITQSNKQRLAILNNETSGENFYSSGGAGSEEAIKTNEGPDSGQSDVINAAVKCSASLYNFTFWFITLTLGSFALLSLLATLLFIYNRYRLAIIRGSTPRSHQATNSTGVVNNGANLP